MTHIIHSQRNQPINAELLDEELRALGITGYLGFSSGPAGMAVLYESQPGPAQISQIQTTIQNHNANGISARESRHAQRRAALATLRAADTPLDISAYDSLSAPVRMLARKILLLEAELRQLRNVDDEPEGGQS